MAIPPSLRSWALPSHAAALVNNLTANSTRNRGWRLSALFPDLAVALAVFIVDVSTLGGDVVVRSLHRRSKFCLDRLRRARHGRNKVLPGCHQSCPTRGARHASGAQDSLFDQRALADARFGPRHLH